MTGQGKLVLNDDQLKEFGEALGRGMASQLESLDDKSISRRQFWIGQAIAVVLIVSGVAFGYVKVTERHAATIENHEARITKLENDVTSRVEGLGREFSQLKGSIETWMQLRGND